MSDPTKEEPACCLCLVTERRLFCLKNNKASRNEVHSVIEFLISKPLERIFDKLFICQACMNLCDKITTYRANAIAHIDKVTAETKRVFNGLDRVVTESDNVVTESSRVVTGSDREVTESGRILTESDRTKTSAITPVQTLQALSRMAKAAQNTTISDEKLKLSDRINKGRSSRATARKTKRSRPSEDHSYTRKKKAESPSTKEI
ncbi:uncharacterized protein LOC128202947 [Mya arenaria]|uniref:uncharacterized protein LOC128202947 n=1 Tax=Mya arenaria TaxID=6604 RepID=UPI0022E05752|nr:uncharacterized protein LOC128202947 [Mya arenaria]